MVSNSGAAKETSTEPSDDGDWDGFSFSEIAVVASLEDAEAPRFLNSVSV